MMIFYNLYYFYNTFSPFFFTIYFMMTEQSFMWSMHACMHVAHAWHIIVQCMMNKQATKIMIIRVFKLFNSHKNKIQRIIWISSKSIKNLSHFSLLKRQPGCRDSQAKQVNFANFKQIIFCRFKPKLCKLTFPLPLWIEKRFVYVCKYD